MWPHPGEGGVISAGPQQRLHRHDTAAHKQFPHRENEEGTGWKSCCSQSVWPGAGTAETADGQHPLADPAPAEATSRVSRPAVLCESGDQVARVVGTQTGKPSAHSRDVFTSGKTLEKALAPETWPGEGGARGSPDARVLWHVFPFKTKLCLFISLIFPYCKKEIQVQERRFKRSHPMEGTTAHSWIRSRSDLKSE